VTLIRPIATYGCETWTLPVEYVNNLQLFERQTLRRIYGPVQTEEGWRIKNNDELEKLMRREDR
jgi:hypothetical protein